VFYDFPASYHGQTNRPVQPFLSDTKIYTYRAPKK
jgi:hypothetical protein